MTKPCQDFASRLPSHECSLTLTHNQNRDYHETVEEYEQSFRNTTSVPFGWVSEEQRRKAILENDLWTVQWYPDTPVGFVRLAACDLDVLLAAALAAGAV